MAEVITIQFLPGCPNRALAERRVAEALGRVGDRKPAVVLEEVGDEAYAEQIDFHGSPTVLIDGVDAFAERGAEAIYACRIYRTEAGNDGAPSVEQLLQALGQF